MVEDVKVYVRLLRDLLMDRKPLSLCQMRALTSWPRLKRSEKVKVSVLPAWKGDDDDEEFLLLRSGFNNCRVPESPCSPNNTRLTLAEVPAPRRSLVFTCTR